MLQQWQPLLWPELDRLFSFPGEHTHVGNGGLCISREWWQGRRGWSRGLVCAVGCTGAVLAGWPEHLAVFSLLPLC